MSRGSGPGPPPWVPFANLTIGTPLGPASSGDGLPRGISKQDRIGLQSGCGLGRVRQPCPRREHDSGSDLVDSTSLLALAASLRTLSWPS